MFKWMSITSQACPMTSQTRWVAGTNKVARHAYATVMIDFRFPWEI
jgi:hypothetical protein